MCYTLKVKNDELKRLIIIDKKSPIPLYFQLKSGLLKLINENYFLENEKIPTEIELTELFNISRPTIRQALNELIHEGYITRQKAKGTFIKNQQIGSMFFSQLQSFAKEMSELGMVGTTKVIDVKTVNNYHGDLLEVFSQELASFIMLQRVRSADQKKVVYVISYIPKGIFGDQQIDFSNMSLYEILDSHGHAINKVERNFTAINATSKIAKLLDLKTGDALLNVFTKAYDGEGQLMEYSIAYYSSNTNFKINLTKN